MHKDCGRKSRKSNNEEGWGRKIPIPRDKNLLGAEQKKMRKITKKRNKDYGFLRSNVIPY